MRSRGLASGSALLAAAALACAPSVAGAGKWFRRASQIKGPAAAVRPAAKVTTAPSTAAKVAAEHWTTGSGPRASVVYLHGLGDRPTNELTERLLPELERAGASLDIVAPWLRPVTRTLSGKVVSTGPQTMSDQLARAREVIRAEKGPVVLIGHSFGGKAALELAKEFPGKVTGVVALAPSVNMLYSYWKRLTGERGLPASEQVTARLDAHERALRALLTSARTDRLRRGSIEEELEYLVTMKDLARHNEPAMERNVSTPTLVLHGTDDRAVSKFYIQRFAEANPGVRVISLEGVDHGFEKEADVRGTAEVTRTVAREIAGFVKDHAK